MTLNEAIAHARKVAENNIRDSKYTKISNNKQMNDKYVLGCIECAKEHEQLAEWLEELKAYRASVFSGEMTQTMLKEEYCKAVDDFLEKIQWEYLNGCGIEQKEIEFLIAVSSQVAEQLKGGDVE